MAEFLTYKDKPLVRCKNEIYYGDMSEPYVVRFEILSSNNDIQLSLFDDNTKVLNDKEINKLMDNINDKLGKDIVYKASSIEKDK